MTQSKTLSEHIENTEMLSQGIPLGEEMLASIAISLKRLADRVDDLHNDLWTKQYNDDARAYSWPSTMQTVRSLLRGLPASATATKIDEIIAAALGEKHL